MLELEHRFRVVDVHTLLDAGDVDATPGPSTSPERLEREMHQAGIVRSVVFPGSRPGGYLAANNAVARLSVDRPFVAFARISGPLDARDSPVARVRNLASTREETDTSPADVEQYAYDDRFHGFTIAPATDGLVDEEVLDRLESVNKPVIVHGGEGFPPSAIETTLLDRSFPVIVAGFGGFPLNRKLMAEAIGLLDEYDNYYLDTSFVRYRDLMERALREHPDRVLFGSGTPAAHPNVAIMEILTLNVPEDTMSRAFSDNATRVIDALAPQG